MVIQCSIIQQGKDTNYYMQHEEISKILLGEGYQALKSTCSVIQFVQSPKSGKGMVTEIRK